MSTRQCIYCKEVKDIEEFYVNVKKTGQRSTLRQKNDPEGRKRAQVKYHYGISGDDYTAMIKNQSNKCAICGSSPNKKNRSLCVDHNHITNKVRELLCDRCNFILGSCDEDKNILNKCIKYLEKHD